MVPFRLAPPTRHELAQLLGMLGGDVVALRGVLGHVVQLPRVVLRVRHRLVEHRVVDDRLPAVVVQGAAAEHLEVLRVADARRRRVVERGRERHAVDRRLRDAVDLVGRLDAEHVEDGRRQVDRVHVLAAHLAPGVDPSRPRDDERIGDAALVDLALPATERRVAGHRPAPRIVVVCRRSADLVDAGDGLLDGTAGEVPRARIVDRPVLPALRRRPVVREGEHERVVEPPDLFEEVEHPPDLMVGVAQEGREALHEARRHALLVARERVPRRHPLGARRELGPVGQETELLLPGEGRLPPLVPAGVEVAAVPLDPVRRRVVGGVAGARAEIEEERLVGVGGLQVGDELDRAVGDVRAEVVAVLPRPRRRHAMAVVHERGRELVRLAAEEAVEAVEAAPQRPPGPRRAEVALVVRREVPLADRVRAVAERPEHLGEKAVLLADAGVIPGEAGGEVGDPAHADAVVVAPGEDAGAGRGAQRGGVEVRVAQAVCGQPVERRCGDVGPEAAELCEAHVVEQDDQHVGRSRGRTYRVRPPRCRLVAVPADHAAELCPFAHRYPL